MKCAVSELKRSATQIRASIIDRTIASDVITKFLCTELRKTMHYFTILIPVETEVFKEIFKLKSHSL